MDQDDDRLLLAVAAGDDAACRTLMDRHLSRVLAVARRMLGSGADAEDVAQEVFLRVWTNAEKWKPGGAKFSTWLHKVTVNLCLDRLRRRGTVPLEEVPDPEDDAKGPAEQLHDSEVAQRVDQALQALPERQRIAIVLCHHEGLTNIEAAEVLEVTVEAVESLLGRGRRALRKSLRAEVGDLLGGVGR